MSITEKVFTLPNRDEMLERLRAVDNNSHMIERFYPKLLKEAGTEKVAAGVVTLILLAIHDYTEGMPALLADMISMRMNKWIDALVPDAENAQETKAFYAQVERRVAAGPQA